jgi:hypothetical protein
MHRSDPNLETSMITVKVSKKCEKFYGRCRSH